MFAVKNNQFEVYISHLNKEKKTGIRDGLSTGFS
jgi:hypothetical protein